MEEPQKKIVRINVFQTSMSLGGRLGLYMIVTYAVMGLSVILPSLSASKFANGASSILSLMSFPLLIGGIFVAYYQMKRFRDANSPDIFPFAIAWMLTLFMYLFATVLSSMAAFAYFKFIDNGIFGQSMIARLEEATAVITAAQNTAEQASATGTELLGTQVETLMDTARWAFSQSASGITKMIAQSSLTTGNILSIIIAILVTKRIKLKDL